MLLKEFEDRPETGERDYAKYDRDVDILYQQRTYQHQYAYQCKYPPTFGAEIVFPLNDQRMKQPNA